MKESFYPHLSAPISFDPVHPRDVLPLREPPPSHLIYPPVLPPESRSRVDAHSGAASANANANTNPIIDGFAFSTHVVPAAYPRVTPFVPLASRADVDLIRPKDSNDSSGLTKEERWDKAKSITEEILGLKARQTHGEFPPDEREDRVLWNCVNRYYRKVYKGTGRKRKSITLLLLHANGFHKESWESLLRHLILSIERTGDDGSVSVDEIWALEETQHGDSALLNENKLSAVYDWSDNSRDILNFLTRYLPERDAAFSADLPVYLPRVSYELENARLQNGFTEFEGGRTLVAIGHSLGGATVTLAALIAPALFTALILVDPTIVPPYSNRSENIYKLALGAVQRRHAWSSREEAKRLFASTPFFAAWDPEVLDSYVQFGLTPSPTLTSQSVKLKMPGIQEAAIFAESRTSNEIFVRLKDLDPRVSLHWVMAGKGSWITGSEIATRDLVWRRPVNSTNTQIASGHLIVQEVPEQLALEVHTYLEWLFGERENSRGKARL